MHHDATQQQSDVHRQPIHPCKFTQWIFDLEPICWGVCPARFQFSRPSYKQRTERLIQLSTPWDHQHLPGILPVLHCRHTLSILTQNRWLESSVTGVGLVEASSHQATHRVCFWHVLGFRLLGEVLSHDPLFRNYTRMPPVEYNNNNNSITCMYIFCSSIFTAYCQKIT